MCISGWQKSSAHHDYSRKHAARAASILKVSFLVAEGKRSLEVFPWQLNSPSWKWYIPAVWPERVACLHSASRVQWAVILLYARGVESCKHLTDNTLIIIILCKHWQNYQILHVTKQGGHRWLCQGLVWQLVDRCPCHSLVFFSWPWLAATVPNTMSSLDST